MLKCQGHEVMCARVNLMVFQANDFYFVKYNRMMKTLAATTKRLKMALRKPVHNI